MKFETKVKTDPTRIEKVFTASQIMSVFLDASTIAVEEIAKIEGIPVANILAASVVTGVVGKEFFKLLGLDKEEGMYEPK